ncbi:flagellar assembly protein FliH [Undibacterium sp. WLX3042]|uniref:flagellar assembly protein FliH n=1 Tax=Undibacterium sp. WLX3042 TaxID=3412686 RepID=UPI003C2C38B8
MSSVLRKDDVSAYQRWEMASFGETRPHHMPEPKLDPVPARLVPTVSEQELEEIREKARQEAYAVGYQEAYERGLREGQEAGQMMAAENMQPDIQSMHILLDKLSAELKEVGKTTGKELLDLAISLASAILKTRVELDQNIILPIVEDAIAQLPSAQVNASISLNPADANIVKKNLGDTLIANGWRIVPDQQLSRGDCKIETSQNLIDSSIDTRWERLTAILRKNASEAE